jgi:ABC-2 type transport system ATP-binding protein
MKIELRGVVKRYGSVRALDHVSLEIDPGQIISLLGPNGAGKTTLIRCLTGIAVPDDGGVWFDDQEFRRDRMELRRRLHLLPDFPFLFWNQSILQNIAIVLHQYDADGDGAETRVLALLEEFDLLPLALRPIAGLSRGQAYKTALVAMIAADRDLWLLDEPFASGMDPQGIDAFKRAARAAAARGRTIIYSTQLLDVAERFSTRACIIHQGEIRAFDTVEKLRELSQDKDNVLESMFRRLRETAQ